MATTRVRDIVSIAARLSKVPERDILGDTRLRHIVMVRQAVYLVAHNQGVHSTCQIGMVMGRDHSTVIHGCRIAQERAKRDVEYAHLINRIEQESQNAQPFLKDWGEQFEFVLARAQDAERRKAKPKQLRPMFAVPPADNDPAIRFNAMMEAGSRALAHAIVTARA